MRTCLKNKKKKKFSLTCTCAHTKITKTKQSKTKQNKKLNKSIKLPTKTNPSPDVFTGIFYEMFRDCPILHKPLQETEEEEAILNFFYETNFILIPKPNAQTETTNQCSLYRPKNHHQNSSHRFQQYGQNYTMMSGIYR